MTKSKWELDPFFCTVDFSVKHLAITSVKGCFHEIQANIVADPDDMTTAEIDFTIQVDSLDTRIKRLGCALHNNLQNIQYISNR